ncbi:hypothetical protein ACIPL1_10590 [Pseudomonas sp. NPDC090202]|uniref:hypothetical protein n=1 Tax=unclassified Pseudomonas TaxID=196821 RepID=UPI00381CFD34
MVTDMELHVLASLLRRGKSLDELSTGLALVGTLIAAGHGLLVAVSPWIAAFGVALLIMGLLQKYWAIRVAFDADLLQRLADSPQALADNTEALDHALATLALQPADKAGRPWNLRLRGALALLYRQAALLAAQIVLTLGFVLASPWLLNAG